MKAQVAAALKHLDSQAIRRLAEATLEDVPTSTDRQVDALATKLGDLSTLRRATERLSPTGIAGLSLLAALPNGALAADLDVHARRLSADGTDASAAEELEFQGLAWSRLERTRRGTLRRVHVLAPLARRLASLADERAPTLSPPAPPTADALHYAALRPAYQLALAAAAIASHAPRLTDARAMHKRDAEAVLAAIPLPRAQAEELAELLIHSRLVRREDDRARIVASHVPELDRGFAFLLATRLKHLSHARPVLAGVAHLAHARGWIADAELLRIQALDELADPARTQVGEPVAPVVARLPGVLSLAHAGRTWLHATAPLRRFVDPDTRADQPRPTPILIQPNYQVIVQVDTPPAVVAQLGRVARIVSSGDATVFAFEEDKVRRAATEGLDPATLIKLLEAHAAHGVPATVARTLFEWARTRAKATIVTGTVLLTDLDEPTLMTLVEREQVTAIGPGAWLVDDDAARAIARALRAGGVQCVVPPTVPERTARWNEDGWDDAEERIARILSRSGHLPDPAGPDEE